MFEARVTTDHDEIRQWVEERGGRPATVSATSEEAASAGVLRIAFPERGDDEALEEIDWDTFFKTFESEKLAFLHQDSTSDGSVGRFSKFINRDS